MNLIPIQNSVELFTLLLFDGKSFFVNSDDIEDSDNWEITSGLKKYGNTIEFKQSYEGCGDYDTVSGSTHLTGSVTESDDYSYNFQ